MKKKKEESILNKDITPHIIASLAVFGLVVSSLVTTAGVAALGVEAQVAFAQNQAANQTATVALAGDDRPASAALLPNASSTPPRPPMDQRMGTSSAVGQIPAPFCPKILRTVGRGSSEATTTGDVGQLQQFMANHFGLDPKDVVTGHFGSTTQSYLEKFQQEQGIPPAPIAGPLTRAAIARICGSQNAPQMEHRDNTQPPVPPVPPTPPAPPKPVSYTSGAANAASMVEAVSEIGDGYAKLFQATLASFGF